MMKAFKEIYIFVAGVSPQVITETIYALAVSKPPVYPNELYIITTSLGKAVIKDHLIERGILNDLFNEYQIPAVTLNDNTFLIPQTPSGKEMDDIKTEEDNEALADLITSFVGQMTKDNGNRLHCSIAGGRKTMSFYLGATLELFGRPWDRLYHVIVSPEFESNPDFFYKPRAHKKIKVLNKDGQEIMLNTDQAKIYLADLPFIRLGKKLNLKGNSFKELVAEGQAEIETALVQPDLMVERTLRRVQAGDHFFHLRPRLMFVYVVFLRQKLSKCRKPDEPYCLDCKDCYAELPELFSQDNLVKFKDDFIRITACDESKWSSFLSKWKSGLAPEVVRQYITKINWQIEKQLENDFIYTVCKINSQKIYGGSRYGLRVEKAKINIH
jgi:CRISPR-associated protein (TIGR02584 family)